MQVQNKMFIVLAAAAMLALTASAQQVTFVSNQVEAETEVSNSAVYTAYAYIDTYDGDSCVLDNSQGDYVEGLLFESWDVEDICIVYKDDEEQYYVSAILEGDEEVKLVSIGGSKYSYKVMYMTSTEKVYVQRTEAGADSTSTFKMDEQSVFTAQSLTAHLTVEEDYADIMSKRSGGSVFYPYESAWTEVTDSEYEVSVTITSGNDRCFTPSQGALSDTEICVEYNDDLTVSVWANDYFINCSEPLTDVTRIKALYTTFDNLIWIQESSGKDTDLFFIPSFDIVYYLTEGDMAIGSGDLSLKVHNTMEDPFKCVSFRSSLLKQSVLYPNFEAMCVTCARESTDKFICDLDFLILEYNDYKTLHNLTLSGNVFELEEGIEITYSLDTGMFTFDFFTDDRIYDWRFSSSSPDHVDRRKFTKYADDLVAWVPYADETVVISMNRAFFLHNRIQYGYSMEHNVFYVTSLDFQGHFDGTYSLACNVYRCYLGFLSGTTFSAVKDYEGQFTDYVVSSFVKNDDYASNPDNSKEEYAELICLSLMNYFENEINDCGNKAYWLTYERVVAQFPIYIDEIYNTGWNPINKEE